MRYPLLIVLLLLLTGCATTPPRTPAPSRELAWQEHQAQLATLSKWKLTGRLAIQNGDDGWNATLIWQQTDARFEMQLIAPLGQGSVQLEGDSQGVVLRNSEGRSAVAADADQLILAELGWRVPLSALRYWVVGLPAPGESSLDLDEYGRLAKLRQQDWEVSFPDYTMQGKRELPARLFVTNHKAQVRLVIKRWELVDSATR